MQKMRAQRKCTYCVFVIMHIQSFSPPAVIVFAAGKQLPFQCNTFRIQSSVSSLSEQDYSHFAFMSHRCHSLVIVGLVQTALPQGYSSELSP